MGTCIYETISNEQSEYSESQKESSFIFVIAALFTVLWILTGFTGIVALSCAAIAIVSVITGTIMILKNRQRSPVVEI